MADDKDRPMDRATFLRVGLRRLVRGASEVAVGAADAVGQRLGGHLLRPPGALAETEFLLACTRCNECATACPHDAILPAGPDHGPATGTPHILARRLPCYLCEDLPCIKACADGALVSPKGGRSAVRMGTARVLPRRCLAHQGRACDVCVQCCPFPDLALKSNRDGHPIVSSDHCTGCGICVQVCPADPAALVIDPR